MKYLVLTLGLVMLMCGTAHARVKYIDGYYKSDGSYTRGHYRDTSNDGYEYNNANYLGYNNY